MSNGFQDFSVSCKFQQKNKKGKKTIVSTKHEHKTQTLTVTDLRVIIFKKRAIRKSSQRYWKHKQKKHRSSESSDL